MVADRKSEASALPYLDVKMTNNWKHDAKKQQDTSTNTQYARPPGADEKYSRCQRRTLAVSLNQKEKAVNELFFVSTQTQRNL